MRTDGMTLAEKLAFYSKDQGECRIWTGDAGGRDYGRLWWKGRGRRAHRLAWEMANGPIPSGLGVLHRCDNRLCIRVEHLFLGTPRDNTRDMLCKGRAAVGERAGPAKLTAQAVLAIRADQRPQADVARDHGVSISNVRQIQRGLSWRHLLSSEVPA